MRLIVFFFFNDTATTEIYTLSLHDALPISPSTLQMSAPGTCQKCRHVRVEFEKCRITDIGHRDRKSTRLNSSHANISYAVFCLKKKKNMSPQFTTISNLYYFVSHSNPQIPT